MMYSDIATKIVQRQEEMVMQAVREVGIDVNKDELVKALQYDRNSYDKGYRDGFGDRESVIARIKEEIKKCDYECTIIARDSYINNKISSFSQGLKKALEIIE